MDSETSLTKFEKYVKTSLKVGNAHLVSFTSSTKYSCVFCKVDFLCEGSLYVHLTTIRHLGVPNKSFRVNPKFECNICGSDLALSNLTTHLCVEKAYKNYYGIIKFIDEFGCPNMCLLCRGTMFDTPAHLNIHILIKHKWNDFVTDEKVKIENNSKMKGLKCPLCLAIFRTNDLNVLHLHAFEEHLSEIRVPFLKSLSAFRRAKYGSENDMKQWLTKELFSCYFPNSIVKKYPMTKCNNINRTLPAFNLVNCNLTFTSMINLTSHLCSHHFLNGQIIKRSSTKNKRKSIDVNNIEYELRINTIQKELDLKNRNLIDRNIIINVIPAWKYCFECFTLFKHHFELQVHYLVAHSHFEWNICGLCNYDCTKSLSISEDMTKSTARSNNLIWKARKMHLQSHIKFFYKLIKNPEMEITKDLLPELSNDLKITLEPLKSTASSESVEMPRSIIQKTNFTPEQKKFLTLLGEENRKTQINLMIADNLYNAG